MTISNHHGSKAGDIVSLCTIRKIEQNLTKHFWFGSRKKCHYLASLHLYANRNTIQALLDSRVASQADNLVCRRVRY
jgi:hypothetical protein